MDREQVNRRWDALAADSTAMDREVVSRRWDEVEQGTFTAKSHARQDAEEDDDDERRRRDQAAAILAAIIAMNFGS